MNFVPKYKLNIDISPVAEKESRQEKKGTEENFWNARSVEHPCRLALIFTLFVLAFT